MKPMPDMIAPVRDFITSTYFHDGPLHAGALLMFTALIPFFSMVAVMGIRRTAARRMGAVCRTFPELQRTEAYELYTGTFSRVSGWRYIVPLIFLFCLNAFLSIILLDGGNWTDTVINANRRVFLLCGSHCISATPAPGQPGFDLGAYQTQTLVTVSYAFLGWMIWTFTAIFDRAATQQLYPATFNRLLVRLAVAVLVAVVVRHMADDLPSTMITSGPVLAFAIGIFPERGLALISDKFGSVVRSPTHSDDFNLELIEGIDATTTYRLQELGINDGADLARANPFAIFDALAIPMSEATDWVAQAQLLLQLKSDRFQTLQKAGYRSIFDLIRLLRSANGAATLQTLCNWAIPAGYDLIAAIISDGDYRRLAAVCVAMGSAVPEGVAPPGSEHQTRDP
jgi:hypothetical protein